MLSDTKSHSKNTKKSITLPKKKVMFGDEVQKAMSGGTANATMSQYSTADAVAGGAGVLGGLIQGISAPFMYKRSRRHADLMADKSWDKNKKMWRMQNEYNHPKNQMKRFMEAGLNPHLIYGKGTPGNAQAMPTYKPGHSNYPDSINVGELGNYMGAMQNKKAGEQAILGAELDNQFNAQTFRDRKATVVNKLSLLKESAQLTTEKKYYQELMNDIINFGAEEEKKARKKEFAEYNEEGLTKANSYRIRNLNEIINKFMEPGNPIEPSDALKMIFYLFMPEGGIK